MEVQMIQTMEHLGSFLTVLVLVMVLITTAAIAGS